MQRASVCFLALALTIQGSDGLVIASKRGNSSASARTPAKAPPSQSNVAASSSVLVQHSNSNRVNMQTNPVLVRPNAGKGADIVHFALQILNFYGTNLKAHTIALDMAMSVRWTDPRVVELIPAGLEQLSMDWNEALKRVWMPGIVVTNRDIEKYEIISSSVTLFRTGEVLRVERAQTRVMKKFDLASYPFDTQHLGIKVASSKYMLNEVVLVANNQSCGVEENIFGLYDVQGWHANVYETRDGVLKKSRGVLEVVVKRQIEKYFDDHLVPTFIVLAISWAVFFFPFANPFITPRLALSILALLTFTNLMVKSVKELPGAAPFNWNDLFNQQIQTFMFITIVFNISTEIMFHQFHKEKLARMMNHESKVFVPCICLVNIVLILGSAVYGWMSLLRATVVTKASSFVLVACYAGYVYLNWYLQKATDFASPRAALMGIFAAPGAKSQEGEDDGDCGAD